MTDQWAQNLANIVKTGNRTLKRLDLQWNRSIIYRINSIQESITLTNFHI